MSSSAMKPMPLVRPIQMRLLVSRFSYSSMRLGKISMNVLDPFLPAARRFQRQAADPEVAGHHALPAEHLEDLEDLFALAEAVEEDAHGADIDGVRAQPDQVAVEAGELGEHHAHPLRLRGDFELQQFLHRQAVAEVVGERGEVVHAVGERHRLLVGFDLALLLDAGVQEADIGLAFDDDLAVEFDQQAQHAVGGRVLRAHVEDHAAGAAFAAAASSTSARMFPGMPESLIAKPLGPVIGIILAQRVAFPILRHHDALQVPDGR